MKRDESARSDRKTGETGRHLRLKRLALLWAQARGYSACALEVRLPRSRYRADVVAYRPGPNESTVVFECKQARPDLRRDNCCSPEALARLETLQRRRLILEHHLRIHYPSLRIGDSLFPEFESHDFAAIGHTSYGRVLREMQSLQNRLHECTKFETLARYRCANSFFLVVPEELFRESEVPVGWGALVETANRLILARKPVHYETAPAGRLQILQRIAAAGTRALNRQQDITFEEIAAFRQINLFDHAA